MHSFICLAPPPASSPSILFPCVLRRYPVPWVRCATLEYKSVSTSSTLLCNSAELARVVWQQLAGSLR
ncbi:hypothetical protein AGOR_G00019980 [Albula goreensis]|uniref:Uncharacterized protein n=1 Tax=Albula goreensis TaxID=1534307 RepID=A0A8T3E0L2_9TELE|nr:hypothetical protein AGOR_G00019980 [Albula goreensis]